MPPRRRTGSHFYVCRCQTLTLEAGTASTRAYSWHPTIRSTRLCAMPTMSSIFTRHRQLRGRLRMGSSLEHREFVVVHAECGNYNLNAISPYDILAYICIRIRIRVHTHTHICMYIHAYTCFMCMHACVHSNTHTLTHTHIQTCIPTCMHAYIQKRTDIYTFMHAFTYTHTRKASV
jgi:hypothetical protein